MVLLDALDLSFALVAVKAFSLQREIIYHLLVSQVFPNLAAQQTWFIAGGEICHTLSLLPLSS